MDELAHNIALDAARYQWLRKKILEHDDSCFDVLNTMTEPKTNEEFDAVLDTVIKEFP